MGKCITKVKIGVYECWYKAFCLLHKAPQVVDTDSTIEKIITERCSISRYGDGEFSLIFGQTLPFQKYNDELAKKLREILKSETENHLVAIPNVFGELTDFSDKSKTWWSEYLLGNRKKIYDILDRNKIYYDAQMTRIYINRNEKKGARKRFNKIKSIWEDKRILIIEGELSRFGVGNDLFSNCKEVKRILVPSKDAFDKYNQILESVLRLQKTENIELILLAIGPTATCLAFDLYNCGMQTIDIGNLDMEYEWMKKGVENQIPIKGKYTHEAKNGSDNIADVMNEKYENEIILKIL